MKLLLKTYLDLTDFNLSFRSKKPKKEKEV